MTPESWMLSQLVTTSCGMRYRGSLSRQLVLSSCTLSLPWLQTETLHGLEESEPEVEKGTTLIWNLQIVKSTSAYLLRMGESWEPNGNKHKYPKTIWKMANSSAYLHRSYKYPCVSVCNVVFMSLGIYSPAVAYCNISQVLCSTGINSS